MPRGRVTYNHSHLNSLCVIEGVVQFRLVYSRSRPVGDTRPFQLVLRYAARRSAVDHN